METSVSTPLRCTMSRQSALQTTLCGATASIPALIRVKHVAKDGPFATADDLRNVFESLVIAYDNGQDGIWREREGRMLHRSDYHRRREGDIGLPSACAGL